ncbi:MAG TPA: NAD(P)/FAD-dependent oxidoreductase [Actinomycetota bacterium]|nr:NAD(P)/FAD-dependent oxidoreductase [Actinomycetota bacterium]
MTASANGNARPAGGLPPSVDVAVVGSGFGGLCAAVALRRAGRDFVVLERGDDVGGTWRDNSYPGCACDVPSHLYSFSFAPNPNWSRSFSPQPEIQAYLRGVARSFGVLPRVRFGAEVLGARWDPSALRWRISTTLGDLEARVLVAGTGPLSEPSIPNLPGLERFEGTTFHSAQWRHDHDLAGEQVGVVGTGASAIQFVPHVQRAASHLTLFQRTAPWVLPRRDRDLSRPERWLFRRAPAAQRLARSGIYWWRESWILGFERYDWIMAAGERYARWVLRRRVPDPALRAKLTPSYRLGCKRVLLANDYYPALGRPNVEVVTDRIVEVLARAIVTSGPGGERREHPVDTIVFGTGFHATDQPIAGRIVDGGGRSLAERWAAGGMSALNGLTVAGFPNLFLLVGPNTALGHSSIVIMIEAQVHHLVQALGRMDAGGVVAIEPDTATQAAYGEQMQRRLSRTVWNSGGCRSWYLDDHGRNTILWPTFTFTFRRELADFDPGGYVAHRPAGALSPS